MSQLDAASMSQHHYFVYLIPQNHYLNSIERLAPPSLCNIILLILYRQQRVTATSAQRSCNVYCNAIIAATLPQRSCNVHCNAIITATLPQRSCDVHCNATATATLMLLISLYRCRGPGWQGQPWHLYVDRYPLFLISF